MLTIEDCTPGRAVERTVSGPNGATRTTYRGFVVKSLRSRVRVEWKYSTGSYTRSQPMPVLHHLGAPFTTDVKPEELR